MQAREKNMLDGIDMRACEHASMFPGDIYLLLMGR